MRLKFLIIFVLVLFAGVVSADFEIGNVSHELIYDSYGSGDNIKAWVNISFVNESINSVFADSFGNSISLSELLVKNKNLIYTLVNGNISADFQKISLDKADFVLPENYSNYIFKLNLSDVEIFSENITIGNISVVQNITPTKTASAVPTEFEVIVNSSKKITKYKWNFGDNKTETTLTNKVTHTYNSTGEYELKITITDSANKSSYKIFDISVGSPEAIIEEMIDEMQEDLVNVKAQIIGFGDLFYQDNLNSVLGIANLELTLTNIQKDYAKAVSEAELNKVLTNLLVLNIPKSVSTSKTANSISFYPERYDINLDILEEIGTGNYNSSDEDKYIDAILFWYQENIGTKITFKEISAGYGYVEEPVLRVFEIRINEKDTLSDDYYLILNKPDGLEFKEDYSENEKSGYVYINLKDVGSTIVFSTTEDIDFSNVPFFISPELDKLEINTSPINNEGGISWWVLFILVFVLALIIGFVAYIILQEWYKRKYEGHLFRNKNNLYNLITFMENAKERGLNDKEISSKLKKAGWTSEQIRYSMKKHAGKRTGMFEIPIGNIVNMFKSKNVEKDVPQGRTPQI